MREIKFRGLDTNGQWVYGDLKQIGDKRYIMPTNGWGLQSEYLIKTESLGQLTGIKDKNDVKIYEGDIIRKVPEEWPSKSDDDPRTLKEYLHDMSRVSYVEYRYDRFCLVIHEYAGRITGGQHGSIEVIGNIHENGDLLK